MDPALQREWQRRIRVNPDVQQAEVDLEFHRSKIRHMQVRPFHDNCILDLDKSGKDVQLSWS